MMGYSIGSGPSIHLGAELCARGTPPGGIITVAAFTSVRDIVQDLKGNQVIAVLAPIVMMERWPSIENVAKLTCPVLFIHGQLDNLIPYHHSERLFGACASTLKVLHLCPRADHVKFREPWDTVDPVITFLRAHFHPIKDVHLSIPWATVRCPQSVVDNHEQMLASKKEEFIRCKCPSLIIE